MIFLLISSFFEIKDASSIVNLPNIDSHFSMTIINYYNIPELTGFRLKGEKILLYDVSLLGFSYYNELMLGLGRIFQSQNFDLRFIPYFIFLNAGNIKNIGLTEELSIKIKYLNYEGGFLLRNIIYFFKDEITPIEEIFLSYKIDNFSHNFKLSYTFEKDINFIYGMEINTFPLIVRLGFNTSPFTPVFGFGISKGKMRFEFGFISHPLLGFTENFTFSLIK